MKSNFCIRLLAVLVLVFIIDSCKKTEPKGLHIGQSMKGGVVAYILQPWDAGYVDSVPHGLIAAPYDQSAAMTWYNGLYTNTRATDTSLGSGLSNTSMIITSQHAGSYAAYTCATLKLGGDSGAWFLPSLNELNKLYENQAAIGGFSSDYYWSSSEDSTELAWLVFFSNGYEDNGYKSYSGRVRAIRTF